MSRLQYHTALLAVACALGVAGPAWAVSDAPSGETGRPAHGAASDSGPSPAPTAAAPPAPAPAENDGDADDQALLALQLDGQILAETLPTLGRPAGQYLPVGALCRCLDLAIVVTPDGKGADGFIINEQRTFHLDSAAHTVTIGDRQQSFDATLIEGRDDDIYVAASLLSTWLPATFDVDLHNAIINTTAQEVLPAQARRQRERMASFGSGQTTANTFPRLNKDYQLLSAPFIDPSVSLSWRHTPLESAINASYSAFATADVLYNSGSLYVAGTESKPLSTLRFTLGRKDPDGVLLGPLQAREAMIGDVTSPGLSLITQNSLTRGAIVGNYPLQQPSQLDAHTFQGNLPNGWDVELFQNGVLMGYRRSGADGLYTFSDIPLTVGTNDFSLVFHGPQGQLREEHQQFQLSNVFTRPGDQHYQVVGGMQPDGSLRATATYDVGLTKQLAGSLALATLSVGTEQLAYGRAGVRGYWDALFGKADMVVASNGGVAGEVSVQTALGRAVVAAKHAALHNYVSETHPDLPVGDRQQSTVSVSGPMPGVPGIQLALEGNRDDLVGRQCTYQLANRVSFNLYGVALSNRLAANAVWINNAWTPLLTGGVLAAGTVGSVGLRGEVLYGTTGVTDLTLGGDFPLWGGYRMNLGAAYSLATNVAQTNATVSQNGSAYALGLLMDYGGQGTFNVGLTLSMGLAFDPRQQSWHSDAHPSAQNGAASVLVFLDRNRNGRRDPDESPLPGVGVGVSGTDTIKKTDDHGHAFIPNLSSYNPVDVGIAVETLEDPFWRPAQAGFQLVPRPGETTLLEFPIMTTGEISGTVRRQGQHGEQAFGAVTIQLLDEHGQVVQVTVAAYDGFYTFTGLAPGRYAIRLAPALAERLNVTGPSPTITITDEHLTVDDTDLLLKPQDKSVQEAVASTAVTEPAAPAPGPPTTIVASQAANSEVSQP